MRRDGAIAGREAVGDKVREKNAGARLPRL